MIGCQKKHAASLGEGSTVRKPRHRGDETDRESESVAEVGLVVVVVVVSR